MKFSECAKCWKSSAKETPLDGHSALSFLSPTWWERQRGFGYRTRYLWFLLPLRLGPPTPPRFHMGLPTAQSATFQTPAACASPAPLPSQGDLRWSVHLTARQQAACTRSSMTFLRSLPLAFIMKVNRMLFTLLQMPG